MDKVQERREGEAAKHAAICIEKCAMARESASKRNPRGTVRGDTNIWGSDPGL